MRRKLLIFLSLLLVGCGALKKDIRPLKLTSEDMNPSPGEDIEILYAQKDDGQLTVRIDSYALCGPNLSYTRRLRAGKASFRVPEDATVLYIELTGPDKIKVFGDYFMLFAEDGVFLRGTRGLKAALSITMPSDKQGSYLRAEVNQNPELIPLYGIKWFKEKGDSLEQKGIYKEIQQIARDTISNPSAFGALASGMAVMGQTSKALDFLDRYLVIETDPGYAPEIYRHILEADPSYPGLLRRGRKIARIYPSSTGALEYARMELKKGIKRADPIVWEIFTSNIRGSGSYELVSELLEYRLAGGDTALAADAARLYVSNFSQSLPDTMPDSSAVAMARSLYVLALDNLKRGDFTQALNNVDNAVRLSGDIGVPSEILGIGVEAAMGLGDTLIAEDFVKRLLVNGDIRRSANFLKVLYPDSLDRDSLLAHFADRSRAEFRKAPKATFRTLAGNEYSVRGSNCVLFFFSTGCEPCIDERTNLHKLVQQAPDTTVRYLAISTEGRETLSDLKMGGFELCPDSDSLFSKFDITAMPHLFIIDTEGNIRYDQIGTPIDINRITKQVNFLVRRTSLSRPTSPDGVYIR